MSATETKKVTSETIDEVFHGAVRSYETCREELVGAFNRAGNQTIDLFEKTLGIYQATSVPDAQRRVQDLIESSLTSLRANVQSALDTNAKMMDSCKELANRFGAAMKK